MSTSTNQIIKSLKKTGYKITPQRKLILDVLNNSDHHLSPANIYNKVREKYPEIGLVTVYRTLEILDKAGYICRLTLPSGLAAYLLKRCPSGQHHHHLVCQCCGKVVNFNNCNLAELEKKITDETGFIIRSHTLELNGKCPACQ